MGEELSQMSWTQVKVQFLLPAVALWCVIGAECDWDSQLRRGRMAWVL